MPRPADWTRREKYVYQGDGRLWIRITVTLPGGRRIDYGPRQCPEDWGCGRAGIAKAHLKAIDIIEQIQSGQLDRTRAIEESFLEFADRTRAATPIRESSMGIWHLSRALWADRLGPLPVRAVTLDDVRSWYADYMAATDHEPATISSRLMGLRFVLRAAHREGLHSTDLGRVLRIPSATAAPARQNITVDELAPAFAGPWSGTAVFWATLCVTGMRRGELEGLRPAELRDGAVHLSAERTKTKQPRSVPIPAELWPALQAFAVRTDRPRRDRWTRLGVQGLKACGLVERGATIHSLRRMAVSELGRMGFRPALIQVLVGHKSQTMTEFYDGPAQQELHQMVERFWAERVRGVYKMAQPTPNPTESR